MATIVDVRAREILDSRGNPTVEVDVMLEDGFLDHVTEMGKRLQSGLEKLRKRNDNIFEEVRGRGLMVGLRCAVAKERLVAALQERGLLCVGADDNVVRLLPPLIIEAEHVDAALDALSQACQALRAEADGEAQ